MSDTTPPEGPPSGAAPEAPASGRPTFEADLRQARESAGLTLDRIQAETRIPVDVLKRLEDGKLLDDPAFNAIYLRALLKAYAHAVGLSGDDLIRAVEARKQGRYRGIGVEPAEPEVLPAVPGTETLAPAAGAARPPLPAAREGTSGPSPGPTPPRASSGAPAVEALRTRAAGAHTEEAARTEPMHARVATQAVARTPRAFDRSWRLIGGGTLVLVLLFAGLLWLLFRDRTPEGEPRPEPVAGADTTTEADTAAVTVQPTGGPRLVLPLRVTVVAVGNGLQNFRVTEAPEPRTGVWLEAGRQQTYESPESIILWGENATGMGPDAVVEWQGLRFSPTPGTVFRIDRANGQRLLDSLAAAPQLPAPAAPAPTPSTGGGNG